MSQPQRIFVIDGQELRDPDPSKLVEQVRELYGPDFPQITTEEEDEDKPILLGRYVPASVRRRYGRRRLG